MYTFSSSDILVIRFELNSAVLGAKVVKNEEKYELKTEMKEKIIGFFSELKLNQQNLILVNHELFWKLIFHD